MVDQSESGDSTAEVEEQIRDLEAQQRSLWKARSLVWVIENEKRDLRETLLDMLAKDHPDSNLATAHMDLRSLQLRASTIQEQNRELASRIQDLRASINHCKTCGSDENYKRGLCYNCWKENE